MDVKSINTFSKDTSSKFPDVVNFPDSLSYFKIRLFNPELMLIVDPDIVILCLSNNSLNFNLLLVQ